MPKFDWGAAAAGGADTFMAWLQYMENQRRWEADQSYRAEREATRQLERGEDVGRQSAAAFAEAAGRYVTGAEGRGQYDEDKIRRELELLQQAYRAPGVSPPLAPGQAGPPQLQNQQMQAATDLALSGITPEAIRGAQFFQGIKPTDTPVQIAAQARALGLDPDAFYTPPVPGGPAWETAGGMGDTGYTPEDVPMTPGQEGETYLQAGEGIRGAGLEQQVSDAWTVKRHTWDPMEQANMIRGFYQGEQVMWLRVPGIQQNTWHLIPSTVFGVDPQSILGIMQQMQDIGSNPALTEDQRIAAANAAANTASGGNPTEESQAAWLNFFVPQPPTALVPTGADLNPDILAAKPGATQPTTPLVPQVSAVGGGGGLPVTGGGGAPGMGPLGGRGSLFFDSNAFTRPPDPVVAAAGAPPPAAAAGPPPDQAEYIKQLDAIFRAGQEEPPQEESRVRPWVSAAAPHAIRGFKGSLPLGPYTPSLETLGRVAGNIPAYAYAGTRLAGEAIKWPFIKPEEGAFNMVTEGVLPETFLEGSRPDAPPPDINIPFGERRGMFTRTAEGLPAETPREYRHDTSEWPEIDVTRGGVISGLPPLPEEEPTPAEPTEDLTEFLARMAEAARAQGILLPAGQAGPPAPLSRRGLPAATLEGTAPAAEEPPAQATARAAARWGPLISSSENPDALKYAPTVARAAAENKVPEDLVWAVMFVESTFNTRAIGPAVDEAGKHKDGFGLMMITKGLAGDNGVTDTDLLMSEPDLNIGIGTRYLAKLYEKFGTWPSAIAAYNMGATGLLRSMSGGGSLPAGVEHHVGKVMDAWKRPPLGRRTP